MSLYQVGDIVQYGKLRVKIIFLFKQGEHGILNGSTCVVQYLDIHGGTTYQVSDYGFSSPPNCVWLYQHMLTPPLTTKRGNPLVPKEEAK